MSKSATGIPFIMPLPADAQASGEGAGAEEKGFSGATDYIEDLHAPELFTTGASSFANGPGMVTITFVSHRFDNSARPPRPVCLVVGRVVMPIASARALALDLYDYLTKNGLCPDLKAADRPAVQ